MKKPPIISILLLLHVIWIGQAQTRDENPGWVARMNTWRAKSSYRKRMSTFIHPRATVTALFPEENDPYFTDIEFEFGQIDPNGPISPAEIVTEFEFMTFRYIGPTQPQEKIEPSDYRIHDIQMDTMVMIVIFKRLRVTEFLKPIPTKTFNAYDVNEFDVNTIYYYVAEDRDGVLTFQKRIASEQNTVHAEELGTGLFVHHANYPVRVLFYGMITADKLNRYLPIATFRPNCEIVHYWQRYIEQYTIPPSPSYVVPYHFNDNINMVYLATFIAVNMVVISDNTKTVKDYKINFHVGMANEFSSEELIHLGVIKVPYRYLIIVIVPFYMEVIINRVPIGISDKPRTDYAGDSFYMYDLDPATTPLSLRSDHLYLPPDIAQQDSYLISVNVVFGQHHTGGPVFTKLEDGTPVVIGVISGGSGHFFKIIYLHPNNSISETTYIQGLLVLANPKTMKMISDTFNSLSSDANTVRVSEIERIMKVFAALGFTAKRGTDFRNTLENLFATCLEIKKLLQSRQPINNQLRVSLTEGMDYLNTFFGTFARLNAPPL